MGANPPTICSRNVVHMTAAADVRVGVLALQGDVVDHCRMLENAGALPVRVRRAAELDDVDGLVLPGGESTVMIRLLKQFDLLEPLRARVRCGLPVYGSCAGMILLADEILDGEPGQEGVGGIPMTVRRNAFGRQVASFEAPIGIAGVTAPERPLTAVFIRAPWVERCDDTVEVLARVALPRGGDAIVAVRHGNLLATSFHPEVTDDARVHEAFVDMVRRAR